MSDFIPIREVVAEILVELGQREQRRRKCFSMKFCQLVSRCDQFKMHGNSVTTRRKVHA